MGRGQGGDPGAAPSGGLVDAELDQALNELVLAAEAQGNSGRQIAEAVADTQADVTRARENGGVVTAGRFRDIFSMNLPNPF